MQYQNELVEKSHQVFAFQRGYYGYMVTLKK